MAATSENKECRSCNGRGWKITSPRRTARTVEGSTSIKRSPCADCNPVTTLADYIDPLKPQLFNDASYLEEVP